MNQPTDSTTKAPAWEISRFDKEKIEGKITTIKENIKMLAEGEYADLRVALGFAQEIEIWASELGETASDMITEIKEAQVVAKAEARQAARKPQSVMDKVQIIAVD